jgi:hypothetical protein
MELLLWLRDFARSVGRTPVLDRKAMLEALAEASKKAAGDEEHEPAALLYAFGKRTASFGTVGRVFVPVLVRAHAAAITCELDATDEELTVLVAAIASRQIDFKEVRGWMRARLRRPGQRRRPPPKRAR